MSMSFVILTATNTRQLVLVPCYQLELVPVPIWLTSLSSCYLSTGYIAQKIVKI